MSTEGIIAAVIMVIVGIIWLAFPLLRRRSAINSQSVAQQKERAALLTAYERTLASIRDVDEDYLTGKLSPADYEIEREHWAEQGVAILQELEKHGVKKSSKEAKLDTRRKQPAAAQTDPEGQLDDAIEQAIAAYIESSR